MRAAFAALVAATAAGIEAQQGSAPVDPVIAHFREYRAALERDDLPAAEAAAAAAVAASEAASGQRTAVLALNLANLRLELGPPYEALPPARTAHALATTLGASAVDPVAAALTLGRAELSAGEARGAARLLDALAAGEANGALDTDRYNAAVALGMWGIEAKRYDTARSAWATAARLAHATEDPTFARARALTGEGAAIFLANSDRTVQTDGRIRVLSTPDAQAANDAFSIAQRLLLPAAFAEITDAKLTAGQLAFAQAMAWQSALLARIQSNDEELPAPTPAGGDLPAYDDRFCKLRTVRDAEVVYPPAALNSFGVGAVVLHFGLDSAGAVTSRTIAAAIPPGALADAVAETADEWHVEKDPAAPASCRMPPASYVNVRFVLE
jgi:hypothetical protein